VVCDDPTDGNREFGIEISDSIFAPLEMEGTVVCLRPTRAPDRKESSELPRIVVTDDSEWDPSKAAICKLSKEEEKLWHVSSLRISSTKVTNTECLGRPTCSETDIGLAQMSPVCSERPLAEEMVSKVNIAALARGDLEDEKRRVNSSVMQRVANPVSSVMGSETRHSPATAEELSRKWGIGIETARQMLKATAQRGVLKGVHPLTR
jgi:hypothetical protein